MKKLIDIPDNIVDDLKILASTDKRDLKNWIELELIKKVEKARKKQVLTIKK